MTRLSDKAMAMIEYLRGIGDRDVILDDVAEEMGVSKSTVTGVFNGLVKKGLGYRQEAMGQNAEGETKKVNLLKLTEDGKNYVQPTED